MRALAVVRALGPIDLRKFRRDSLLVWSLVYPLLMAALLRWFSPRLEAWLARDYAFELGPYLPLIGMLVLLATPVMTGVVVGFLMLDERDEGVLAALAVTPLRVEQYLAWRIGAPLLALCLPLVAYSQSALDVYTDSLVNGWQNWRIERTIDRES